MNVDSTGEMLAARNLATATPLADGRLLVCGGQDVDGNALATAEIFNPATGAFTSVGNLNTARYAHAAVCVSGVILVAGGQATGGGYLDSAEIFSPGTLAFRTVATGLSSARSGHAMAMLGDGRVLVAGGAIDGEAAIALAELYTSIF